MTWTIPNPREVQGPHPTSQNKTVKHKMLHAVLVFNGMSVHIQQALDGRPGVPPSRAALHTQLKGWHSAHLGQVMLLV